MKPADRALVRTLTVVAVVEATAIAWIVWKLWS